MNQIKLPSRYNYIGVFLTYRCELGCTYCINRYEALKHMHELSTDDWILGLGRIKTREDLPITIGGGEPTIYSGFYQLVRRLYYRKKHMDLLTNGMFDLKDFMAYVPLGTFKRKSKYANIRFSYHELSDVGSLLSKVMMLQIHEYSVGIWGIDSTTMQNRNRHMKGMCTSLNIDFRLKTYLSHAWHLPIYKYPGATACLSKRTVLCKPSEFLINPRGYIFRCHRDMYSNEGNIGHILDNTIKFPQYMKCENYGHCNPCDIKLKFNRFQEKGHCAVTIKDRK